MSANTVIDLGNTCDYRASVQTAIAVSPASGTIVGEIVDLLHANNYCNLYVAGYGSGFIEVRVQTSDGITSGSFTDPTSGLPQPMTNTLSSGGVFFANSGLLVSGNYSLSSPVNNAPQFCSGGIQFGAFQRPQRYARLLLMSGANTGPVQAGFISQKKTTGSGGGYTTSPTSGSVNV